MKRDIQAEENLVPLGRLYAEAQAKDHEIVDLRELEREFNKDYMSNLMEAAKSGLKRHRGFPRFFVVVLVKRERLMSKVLRNYFCTRVTCPTPSHDQTIYIYDTKKDELKFLWVIPSKDICKRIYGEVGRNDALTREVTAFMEGRRKQEMVILNRQVQKDMENL